MKKRKEKVNSREGQNESFHVCVDWDFCLRDVCKIPKDLFVGLFPLSSLSSIYPSLFFFLPPVLLPPINVIFLLPVFHIQIVREEERERGRKEYLV